MRGTPTMWKQKKEKHMTGDDKRMDPQERKDKVRSGEGAAPGSTVSPGGYVEKPSEDPRKDSGLYELDADGNLVLDSDGNPIPKADRPK